MMSHIIKTEHLAYTYPGVDDTPGVAVFEDMNLSVEAGTFVAVLGSNGCGKSTLASILMRFCCHPVVRSGSAAWILLMTIS